MIDLLNNVGAAWAEYFGMAIVQNTVFLGLVFFVLYLLRDASANIRIFVGSVGLAKLLLPPFLPANVSVTSYELVRSLPQTATSLFLGRPPAAVAVEAAPAQLDALGLAFSVWVAFGLAYLVLVMVATARLVWRLTSR